MSFHLDGITSKWFAWLEARNMLSTWKIFVDVVIRKFTNLHCCLHEGKLIKLCQEGFVSEYQSQFEEYTRVLGLPDFFILKMYISRLREEIKAKVLRDKPIDIFMKHLN